MSFIFKITTTTSPQTFVIPCVNIGTFNATVDYGDGTGSQTVTAYNDSNLTHSFATAGQHTITIDGTFPNIRFYNNQESRLLVDEVVDLGDVGWVHLYRAFRDCSNLTTFNLGTGNTSNVTGMSQWFENCTSLTTLDLSSLDTSSATDMSYMFQHCTGLTAIDLSNFDTSSVISMVSMFRNCTSLTSLDVSNFDTSSVVGMQEMFRDCASLTSLDLSNFNTSNVTTIYAMFRFCTSLTTLDISSFDTSNIINMGLLFYNCNALTSIDVSNFNTANVYNMGIMFRHCTSLTTLDVTNFDTSNVEDFTAMFYYCEGLTTLDVTNFDTSSATKLTSMFQYCRGLTTLDLSSFDTSSVISMLRMVSGCTSLTTLDLSTFNTSNVTTMHQLFYGCTSLTSIDVTSFDTSNVVNMIQMFRNCLNLKTLDLSSFDTSNVTDLNYMFASCRSLPSLDLSSFNTSNVTSMYQMFYDCQLLQNLDIKHFNVSNVIVATNFMALSNDALTTTQYDELLEAWAEQDVQPNVSWKFGNVKYTVETIADWASVNSNSSLSIVNNSLVCFAATTANFGVVQQVDNLTIGSTYVFKGQATCSNSSATVKIRIGTNSSLSANIYNAQGTGNVTVDHIFVATATTHWFGTVIQNHAANDTVTIPSGITVKEITNYTAVNPTVGSIDNISFKPITNAVIYKNIPQSAREDYKFKADSWTSSSENVTNGDFATDTNWFKDANWSISGGNASSTGSGRMFQPIAPLLESSTGVPVKVTFDITALTQGGVVVNCYGIESQLFNSVGTHTFSGVTTNTLNLYFNNSGAGGNFIGSIDNVSVKEIIEVEPIFTIDSLFINNEQGIWFDMGKE